MTRIKIHISNVKLPFYPPCEVKCGLQNRVSTAVFLFSLVSIRKTKMGSLDNLLQGFNCPRVPKPSTVPTDKTHWTGRGCPAASADPIEDEVSNTISSLFTLFSFSPHSILTTSKLFTHNKLIWLFF